MTILKTNDFIAVPVKIRNILINVRKLTDMMEQSLKHIEKTLYAKPLLKER
jgi:hypothetical protein